ncbi:hypothetical protein [Pyrococcus kukulkanii]|uniref:hypothetical protein n=1 Tax=Pyrococcus kukulkanii TaxID=1609559 RepID=UPI0035624065
MRSWPRRLLGIEPFQDTEEYNIEMLSKEGKEIKDLQDMSERLRMIVSESRKAFSEVY